MFKAITILALGAVASAQFLDSRDLQTLAQSASINATAFSTACTSSATADSCPASYCCANLKRGVAAVSTAAAVCAPIEFHLISFNITNVANVFTCNQLFNVATYKNATAARVSCNDSTTCAVGSCCGTFSDFHGTNTANATIANRKYCVDGTKGGLQVWGTYAASNVGAGAWSSITQGSCDNVVPAVSFGAYIKASAMMLVAVLSVAFF